VKRKPIIIPGQPQTWAMQTLGRDGILIDAEVIIDWPHVQSLARRALGNKTRQATFGPVRVKVARPKAVQP
jgi:hypothetical protein